MSFSIRPATRQAVRPLIGLYSESGCGKTMSALLLARGFVGPTGQIVMVDSESGRGSLYADVIPGGYSTLEITEPFSPDRYIEAIRTVEQSGAKIGILDSASHSWEGLGGVTDMAAEIEAKTGKTGLHCWKGPKMAHAKFMLKLLQSPIPWVICLRAKHKSRQGKNEHGKTVIIKDEFTSPIQSEDFIFEMTCHGEILQDHSLRLTKCSHPALRECFPTEGPITIQHGEKLARWCEAAAGPAPVASAPAPKAESTPTLKKRLWELLKEKHHGDTTLLQQYMWDEGLIDTSETLSGLSSERLAQVVKLVEKRGGK